MTDNAPTTGRHHAPTNPHPLVLWWRHVVYLIRTIGR